MSEQESQHTELSPEESHEARVQRLLHSLGETQRIAINGAVSEADLFRQVQAHTPFPLANPLLRIIHSDRVPAALETGTDRDVSSDLGFFGEEYERAAMVDNGLAVDQGDQVTYAVPLRSEQNGFRLRPVDACLIYAAECLKPIEPRDPALRKVPHSGGLHMFIDPRLREKALLAVVELGQV